jgi:ankyrin repeat protein
MAARPTEGRQTALHRAAKSGKGKVVKKLVSHKASLNKKDSAGNTALHLATLNRHPSVVTVLLNAGADARCLNHLGETSLATAIKEGNNVVARLFLKHGTHKTDQSAWRAAATSENGDMLRPLASFGPYLSDGVDPVAALLRTAAGEWNHDITTMLVKRRSAELIAFEPGETNQC